MVFGLCGSDYQSGYRYYAGLRFGEWRTGGSGNKTLSINDGAYVNTPLEWDWEVREVLVWNKHLTPSEYAQIYALVTQTNSVKPTDNPTWPSQENLVGWWHASTFPKDGGGVGTEWPNSYGSLGAASVTRGFVKHVTPVIDMNGLNLIRANEEYATLDKTHIGDSLTFAIWVKVITDSNYQSLFAFGDGITMLDVISVPQLTTNPWFYINIRHGTAYQWSNSR